MDIWFFSSQFCSTSERWRISPCRFFRAWIASSFLYNDDCGCCVCLLENASSHFGVQPKFNYRLPLFNLDLCKSWAALIFGVLFISLILLVKVKNQLRIARILVLLVLFYPLLRFTELVPIHGLVDFVADFNEERSQSLGIRVSNEDMLLNHVHDKALFGWGSWGRNRVYDMGSGRDLTTD